MTHQEMEIKIKELEKRIKALEQEQIDFIRPKKSIPITLTVEGDCISRQAASKAISRISLCKCNTNEIEAANECLKAVEDLPSVNPQPKIGHWINIGSGQECSECHEIQYGYDNHRFYCGSCGAKMVEPQESEG